MATEPTAIPRASFPRTVVSVTTARSDHAPSRSMYAALAARFGDAFSIVAGGSHLWPNSGLTIEDVRRDPFTVRAEIPFRAPEATGWSVSAAEALRGFAAAFSADPPDVVVVYGDRYETLSVAIAAVGSGSVLAHVCGGDVTEGAIDDSVRHAITKLAHVHFPSTAVAAARLKQLGEEAWRVHHVGDPALDPFVHGDVASDEELSTALDGLALDDCIVVTFHPVTLETSTLAEQAAEVAAAVAAHGGSVVVTAPAPDPGHETVRAALEAAARAHPRGRFVPSLGGRLYRSLLRRASCVVGNSSSGIIEAGSVPIGAVNIGTRQEGRVRGPQVVDVAPVAEAITAAIARVSSAAFRSSLDARSNPYGRGDAGERIADVLAALPPRDRLLRKRFVDLGAPS